MAAESGAAAASAFAISSITCLTSSRFRIAPLGQGRSKMGAYENRSFRNGARALPAVASKDSPTTTTEAPRSARGASGRRGESLGPRVLLRLAWTPRCVKRGTFDLPGGRALHGRLPTGMGHLLWWYDAITMNRAKEHPICERNVSGFKVFMPYAFVAAVEVFGNCWPVTER